MKRPVPADITGLWRREAMIWPDGRRDETTIVYWLQTASLFADIRLPADRPAVGPDGFIACGDADLIALAGMNGFGGTLEVEGQVCRWHRTLDWAPPGGPPDEANYTLDGDLLIETGLDGSYREDWRRVTPPGAKLVAFELLDDSTVPGRNGILVLAGDHFLMIEGRSLKLPKAASLKTLVEADLAAGRRVGAVGRLAMRIVYGRIAAGWQIVHSTMPWLEGTALFADTPPAWHPGTRTLLIQGAKRSTEWQLVDGTFEGIGK